MMHLELQYSGVVETIVATNGNGDFMFVVAERTFRRSLISGNSGLLGEMDNASVQKRADISNIGEISAYGFCEELLVTKTKNCLIPVSTKSSTNLNLKRKFFIT
jgi:hypothetical protein